MSNLTNIKVHGTERDAGLKVGVGAEQVQTFAPGPPSRRLWRPPAPAG